MRTTCPQSFVSSCRQYNAMPCRGALAGKMHRGLVGGDCAPSLSARPQLLQVCSLRGRGWIWALGHGARVSPCRRCTTSGREVRSVRTEFGGGSHRRWAGHFTVERTASFGHRQPHVRVGEMGWLGGRAGGRLCGWVGVQVGNRCYLNLEYHRRVPGVSDGDMY